MTRVVLLCVIAGACATAPAGMDSAGSDAAAGGWERIVAPFPVMDENGRQYAHPFLGGFDVPRPQFIDIDGDGDLDLFVQERSNDLMFFENAGTAEAPRYVWRTDRYRDLDIGEWYRFIDMDGDRDLDLFVQERSNDLMFFENAGTAEAPRYVWRTDRYRDLDIGEWYRFIDMDGDGDYDMIAEQPYSYIRLYSNTGSVTDARLVLAGDTLRDSEGRAIFADRQNIANAADIDCNGLMDLFLGRVDGTITRYEETPRDDGAVPQFRFVTDRFEGIEIVAAMGGSSRHGANSMYFADVDDDADLDLFWGDFFEAGVLLIRNQGTCPNPNLRGEPEPLQRADGETVLTSGYNVPVLTDIDADGDLDLFLGIIGGAFNPNTTASDNFHFYERTDAGFELRTTRFLDAIDVGSESTVTFADIDSDGDLDMLAGSKIDRYSLQQSYLYVFRNEGSSRELSLSLTDTLDLGASYHYAPVLADLNADGRLELLLGTWNDGVLFFANTGTPQQPHWVQDTTRSISLSRGSNTTPALVDIDDDGDLDLFAGEASGTLNFYRNAGTPADPRFELVSDEFDGIDVGRRSHPAFVDLDGDGDFDLVVGRDEGGGVVFRNDGTRATPRLVRDDTLLPLPPLGSPVFVDLDGDGAHEMVSGNLSGGIYFFRR